MYQWICTERDVVKEHYLTGAELTDLGFPILYPCHANINGDMTATPFHEARKERNPRNAFVHFYIADRHFEGLWRNDTRYLETLSFFKYICGLNFSIYSNMPKVMQMWQKYRSQTMSWWLSTQGMEVIPNVTWSDEASYEWCFDGIPKHSTLTVSTNGCHNKQGKFYFRKGFDEMRKRLEPEQLLIVGGKMNLDCDVPITWFEGYRRAG